ncbi:hypothetical protein [Oceaniglobus roseus]|uniref:hypothetical protein n=1 Tax=Oceaniglobus roseus TaxID=1737570 RepID=UPI000C7F468A|nr:hypothetical protein [Kandeliimicrobium roseum]
MIRKTFPAVLAALMATASPLWAVETYDLIFKTGTLDGIPETEVLTYDRDIAIPEDAEYADRNTGEIRLTFEPEQMARLTFLKDGKHANVGAFPATVGNPVIMYFVETVLRDVAKEAGGSPFYIRNRIKEALVQPVPITDVTVPYDGKEVAAKRIVLRPFENDKNREKMGAYGDLALTFTMSEDVPGWYASLAAEAPDGKGGAAYSYDLELVPGEDGK